MSDGLLAQPVNSWSSLAFLLGAWFVVSRSRLAALAMVLVGVGSLAFHGWPGTVSGWVHDGAIVLLAAVVSWEVGRRRVTPSPIGVGLLGVGVAVWWVSRTGGVWCSPTSLIQGHALWHVLAASAIVALIVQPARET